MPSGQETDWAYSITTVPRTHTGHVDYEYEQVNDDDNNDDLV